MDDVIDEYDLGERNVRGDKLAEFCQYYEMIATN